VIVRTLAEKIVVRAADRLAFEALRFLECNPEIVPAPAAQAVFTVEPFRGRYRIWDDGTDNTDVFDLRSVVDHLNLRLTTLSLRAKPSAAVLHAASLRRGGRRVLITGHESTGKTTLALRLIQSGYDLEGDEHVFLEHDGVTARPRACRVKETSLALLPDVSEVIAAAPVYFDYFGRRIFNLDPRTVGGTWQIEKGQADCVIVLRPNHGGYSSLRPLQPLPLSQALISEFCLGEAGRRASIGPIARLANLTRGYDLSLGDHETAIKCIDRALMD
jgi:hypothetical protein